MTLLTTGFTQAQPAGAAEHRRDVETVTWKQSLTETNGGLPGVGLAVAWEFQSEEGQGPFAAACSMNRKTVIRTLTVVGSVLLLGWLFFYLNDDTRGFKPVDTSVAVAQISGDNVKANQRVIVKRLRRASRYRRARVVSAAFEGTSLVQESGAFASCALAHSS